MPPPTTTFAKAIPMSPSYAGDTKISENDGRKRTFILERQMDADCFYIHFNVVDGGYRLRQRSCYISFCVTSVAGRHIGIALAIVVIVGGGGG